MARPKRIDLKFDFSVAQQVAASEDFNAIKAMIQCAKRRMRVPDGVTDPYKGWQKDWDMITDDKDVRWLVSKKEFVLECAKAVAPYCFPQLKASEHKTTEDRTITWVIKTFAPETTELSVVKPKEIEGGA